MSQIQRHRCRQKRQQLTPSLQLEHARKAARLLLRSQWLQRPKKIALYLDQDGELSTQPLITALWKTHHHLYLPVLKTLRGRPMAFAEYTPHSKLQPNQFGILEPQMPQHQHLTGNQLDLVLMPLTCFDLQGNRIGMGGGFYDRTFAFKRLNKSSVQRPKLIGWAHECQQLDDIVTEKWDIQLEGLVTEKQIYSFNAR